MQDMLVFKAQKKLVGLLGVFGVAVSILAVFAFSYPVAADYPPTGGKCNGSDKLGANAAGAQVCITSPGASPSPTQSGGQKSTDQDDDTTCAIEKMGWILCPLIETAGRMGDRAFELLAKHFLYTEPELVASGNKSGTYIAWELARNIANVMFIIAFLAIIFSQVTGQGINNYGIKRLLPRLIIAAIAVNVSYYICQAMVDLTNVMGFEIQNFMVDRAKDVSDRVAMPPQTSLDVQTANGTLGKIAAGVLGLTVVWLILPLLFLGVSTVVIVCLVIVVILLMRKAFIVLLVVVSPIAFVMYLLPNTEKLFQKWLRMFWQLLLVFPIVGILFGGGQLASAIILIAGSTSDQAANTPADSKAIYDDKSGKCIQLPKWPNEDGSLPQGGEAKVADCASGGGSTPFMLGLVAAGIAVAPLFAVWSVLKGALSAAGTIGGKISGAVQSVGNKAKGPAGKPEEWMRKRAGENIQAAWQRRTARGLENGSGFLAKRNARHQKRVELSKADLERSKQDYLNRDVLNEKDPYGVLNGLSAKGYDRAVASGEAARERALVEDVQAASMTVRNMASDGENSLATIVGDLESGKRNVEDPTVAAAIDELGKRQDFKQLERVLNKIGSSGVASLATRTLSQTFSQNAPELITGGQLGALSRGALGEMGIGGPNAYGDMVGANLAKGIITAEKAASAGPSVLEEASRNAISTEARQSLVNAANAAINDPILKNKIGRNAGILTNFSQGKNSGGTHW